MKTLTFTVACKNFFGLKEGESLLQFAQEIKQLTPSDRAEMTPLLEKALGVTING